MQGNSSLRKGGMKMKEKLNESYKATYVRVTKLINDEGLNMYAHRTALKKLKAYLLQLQMEKKEIVETDEELSNIICKRKLYMSKGESILMVLLFPCIFLSIIFLMKLFVYKQVTVGIYDIALCLAMTFSYNWHSISFRLKRKENYGIALVTSSICILSFALYCMFPDMGFSLELPISISMIGIFTVIICLVFAIPKYRYCKWIEKRE